MQVPSNLLLNKLGKPSLYLPTCMVIWGLISGLTAVCQNYGGLIACRFMLGFVEAAYFVSHILPLDTLVLTTFAAWMPVLSFMLVHEARTWPSNRHILFRSLD